MSVLAGALAFTALALFVWSYFVYPSLVLVWAARRGATPEAGGPRRVVGSIEVILAAADEEAVIGARVENLLGQELPGVSYQVAIGCDGCTDETAARARAAAAGAPCPSPSSSSRCGAGRRPS